MNLEERVVAAEVASRRADGPGVIEVQSQRRSDVAGQGLGPGTQWRGRPVRPGSRGVRRPGADQDARLGVDLDVPEFLDVPQFPPPEPLRLSEVSSRQPGKMAEARGRILSSLRLSIY